MEEALETLGRAWHRWLESAPIHPDVDEIAQGYRDPNVRVVTAELAVDLFCGMSLGITPCPNGLATREYDPNDSPRWQYEFVALTSGRYRIPRGYADVLTRTMEKFHSSWGDPVRAEERGSVHRTAAGDMVVRWHA